MARRTGEILVEWSVPEPEPAPAPEEWQADPAEQATPVGPARRAVIWCASRPLNDTEIVLGSCSSVNEAGTVLEIAALGIDPEEESLLDGGGTL